METNTATVFKENKKPLGLCLSGGGAIGFAHIGVLQALADNGIEAQAIAGSSMGAIVGTLYAAGYTPKEMMQIIKDDRLYLVSKLMTFKPGFWKSGFSTHGTVEKLIRECIPHNSFEALAKKLFICVTNMNTMEWEIKFKGKQLASWVSASASIPGVFEALVKNGAYYLDGGVLNNMPAQPLKEVCRAVIGVDVIPFEAPCNMKHPIDAITCTLRGVEHLNSVEGRKLCDHLIEPKAIKKYHEFRFDAYQKIYNQGYKDAMAYIEAHPEIKEL
ncbi:MAG: patatin-like phospholipase family protein [Bacteroidales bacterium]|nr:patatin-like phospholipase family protein [Bacteroidales bacterium]MDD4361307.1 patatin-like phospholipase family protein [Bacteroidales bacterium]MDD4430651.1 patatin-like phospholipase family protein [Bacteroidales bacterium]